MGLFTLTVNKYKTNIFSLFTKIHFRLIFFEVILELNAHSLTALLCLHIKLMQRTLSISDRDLNFDVRNQALKVKRQENFNSSLKSQI